MPDKTDADASAVSAEPKPRAPRKRAATTKAASKAATAKSPAKKSSASSEDGAPVAKRASRKRATPAKAASDVDVNAPATKRKPATRTKAAPTMAEKHTAARKPAPKKEPAAVAEPASDQSVTPKRRPGRPRKHPLPEPDAMTKATQEATHATAEPLPVPSATLAEADSRHTRHPGDQGQQNQNQQNQNQQNQNQNQQNQNQGRRYRNHQGNNQGGNGYNNSNQGRNNNGYNNGGNQNNNHRNNGYNNQNQNNNQGNGRRRNRHNNNQNQPSAPSLTREELEAMKVAELRSKAAELNVPYVGVKKAPLVEAVYEAAAKAEGFRTVHGILEVVNDGYGFVRTGNYMAGDDDAFVPQQMIKQLGLRAGDDVEGTVRPSRPNDKYPAVSKVTAVEGEAPDNLKARPRFRDLTPVYPDECLVMEHGKESITGRAIDLVSPIGKGQRGLIVSPPKAGKTTVLKKVCESIAANNPEVHLICLLVDERPEEVTDMQRSIHGDVVASTFDMPAENHTAVSELVIERAKRLVEKGQDVVVVLDSITRLARAYNLAQPASGRILSGGVDASALYPPKRFLGAARNIENGGSLTILASALVDTGSKMDEVIFEEFKGTGNMELKLDRDLADKRIFPAIDPVASGTRNEELLLDPALRPFIWGIRRVLANMNNTERAEASLIKGLRQTKSNEEFLIRSAKKAQQTDYPDAV